MLSVFGRRIKGMIRLWPEQVWMGNVTHHHFPLLFKPEILNLSEDLTIIAGECGPHYFFFVTYILHRYLRDQGVGPSDMGSSANDKSNLTKIPKQGGSAHQSAFEVIDKFKQFFNSLSGSVLWQNERV